MYYIFIEVISIIFYIDDSSVYPAFHSSVLKNIYFGHLKLNIKQIKIKVVEVNVIGHYKIFVNTTFNVTFVLFYTSF